VFVLMADQMGLDRLEEASTTTGTFLAQEIPKPNPLVCIPALPFRIRGFESNHNAVGRPANVALQPVAPGK